MKWAKQDDRLEEFAVVVRRRLDDWKDEDFKCKFTVIQMDSFDSLHDAKDQLQGFDAFLCTLGTQIKVGEEEFKKVDLIYPT